MRKQVHGKKTSIGDDLRVQRRVGDLVQHFSFTQHCTGEMGKNLCSRGGEILTMHFYSEIAPVLTL